MSIKKFGPKDILANTMRTHPSCEFFIYDGQIYYNNIPYVSGNISRGASVPVTSGYASLHEMNIDRLSASTGRFIGGSSEANEPATYDLATDGWISGEGAVPGSSTTQYTYTYTADTLVAWWKLELGLVDGSSGSFDAEVNDATYTGE
ncbi:MAG: hypothetical protein QF535_09280, partial [Anaerolineales bacterium]|nr:hypothetical protein [Anaerolineales bacterium]